MNARSWFISNYQHPVCQPSDEHFPHLSHRCQELKIEAPQAVTQSHDWWWETLSDFGGAWTLCYEVEQTRLFVVFVGTDGDEGAVELYDEQGGLLDAAFLDGDLQTWESIDQVRARFIFEE